MAAAKELGTTQVQRIWITRPGRRTRKLVLVGRPFAKEGDVVWQGEEPWVVKRTQFDRAFEIQFPARKGSAR